MTMPFESSTADATAAWDVYLAVAAGHTTTSDIQTNFLNKWRLHEQAGSATDQDFSTAFRDRGVTYLVAAGLVSNNAGTLTPLFTTGGKPRALRRAANGTDVELDPDATKSERVLNP